MIGSILNLFSASKTADVVGDGVARLVDLIPEGDGAARADAQKIASETIKRAVAESGGDAWAQRSRAITRPALTGWLCYAWVSGQSVPPVDVLGVQVTVGTAALLAIGWWFSERGILALIGGKR